MVEIYWLQRIGALSDIFDVMLGIAAIVFIVAAFVSCIEPSDENEDVIIKTKKFAKVSFIAVVVGILGNIFIPSTKEMYAIYGIGGTIDYIKSNDKAKQLPDKCIDALNRYVDSIEKENKDNNNE